jgi:hypothetical protein
LKPRLYIDEDIPTTLAILLRELGYDAVSVHEAAAEGLADEEQLARASASDRAIVSFNYTHFEELAADWFNAGRQHFRNHRLLSAIQPRSARAACPSYRRAADRFASGRAAEYVSRSAEPTTTEAVSPLALKAPLSRAGAECIRHVSALAYRLSRFDGDGN